MNITESSHCVKPRDVAVSSVRQLIEFGAEHTCYDPEEIFYLLRQVYESLPVDVKWKALFGGPINFNEYPACIYMALINALIVIDNHRNIEVPPPDDEESLSPPLSNLLTTFHAALLDREKAA